MKQFIYLAITTLSFIATSIHAATADARMYCVSVRFHHAPDSFDLFTLDLTTLDYGVNGELASEFLLNTGYSHSSYFIFTEQMLGDEMWGMIALDTPPFADVNENGFPDFFESAEAVSANTSGAYQIPGFASGAVEASWSRSAGTRFGRCTLVFKALYGSDVTFSCTFEILEYVGPLIYTPGASVVSGALDLALTGEPGITLEGPLSFTKSPGNPFNQLTLAAGTLTNALQQTLSFFEDAYERYPAWPTNYFGFIEFQDGDRSTAPDDYWLWVLSIDDSNDADHDGVPDFSDTPTVVIPPRPPILTLRKNATHLLLTIGGDVGKIHQVQEISSLTSTNWSNTLSVTLTNDPQTVELALPEGGPRYWRVLAK